MVLRWLTLTTGVSLGCLLGCTIDLPGDDDTSAACLCSSSCSGNVILSCEEVEGSDGDECSRPAPGMDCSVVGATCVDSECHFDETCPADVDFFCRNRYVLGCKDGTIQGILGCAESCVDVTLSNGRKAAACAAAPTESCSTEAPLAAECHGTSADMCTYGIVTSRQDCGSGQCTAIGGDDPEAECLSR